MDLMTSTQGTSASGFLSSQLYGSAGSSPLDSYTLQRRRDVSRVLFDAPDARSEDYARTKLMEICAEDSRKYNFDFQKEVPLEGRWKWEKFGGSSEGSTLQPTVSASSSRFFQTLTPTTDSSSRDALLIVRPVDSSTPTTIDNLPTQSLATTSTVDSANTASIPTEDHVVEGSMSIPSSVLVESSIESLEDKIVPELKPDSSATPARAKTKQPKINAILNERKRRAGTLTSAVLEKKKAI